MKITRISYLIVCLVAMLSLTSCYNTMVEKQEAATTALANVQATYQRRADLIPNLVKTVQAYAKHEKETLEGVVSARAAATQIKLDANDLTPEKLKAYQEAQGAVSQALGKLLAITENYPELKANENYHALMVQLEGSENRINEARQKFNDAVQDYNTEIRTFPNMLFAGMFGFEKMNKFEAAAGAEKAPEVNFD